MEKLILITVVLSTSIFAQGRGHGNGKGKGGMGPQVDISEVKQYFSPISSNLIDSEKNKDLINLGKKLYFEKGLSINNKISCNSCHGLDSFGVDNEATSPGHDDTRGGRNSPTTLNAALHTSQFWDGRAKDLEEQALGPILNPIEMGMQSEVKVIEKLKKIEGYQDDFKKAFPKQKDPLIYKNIGVAIGSFEKTLLTPSRFDDFLNGNMKALNQQEKRGLKKFMHKGCVACHNGTAIGGNQFQVLGAVNEFNTKDLGRFEVTKDDNDKKKFKVPSLRNITHTAPYFHDGSIKTLDEAISLMAWHQLGQQVGPGFIEDVKAFLGSLEAIDEPNF